MAELQKAEFGAGCFWGVQSTFDAVPGVVKTEVGYEGGDTERPTYGQVSSHTTGHAEVVQVTYDPGRVSYEKLLGVFWDNHNPTTMNRQGPDVGTQYRSVIFYHSPEQKAAAEKSKQELEASGKWHQPIVTSIEPAKAFWPAEEYHQKYLEKNGLKICH